MKTSIFDWAYGKIDDGEDEEHINSFVRAWEVANKQNKIYFPLKEEADEFDLELQRWNGKPFYKKKG